MTDPFNGAWFAILAEICAHFARQDLLAWTVATVHALLALVILGRGPWKDISVRIHVFLYPLSSQKVHDRDSASTAINYTDRPVLYHSATLISTFIYQQRLPQVGALPTTPRLIANARI
jgi:hypothetical protein